MHMCVYQSLSYVQLFATPQTCSPSGSSVHGDSLGKNTGVGCQAFLQGVFPTQGSNPCLPHCRQNCLSPREAQECWSGQSLALGVCNSSHLRAANIIMNNQKDVFLCYLRCLFYPWITKFPWTWKWQPVPVFLLGKFHGQEKSGRLEFMGLQRVGHD